MPIPALIAVALAQATAPTFAPLVDRPITCTTTETRNDGQSVQRFTIVRRVTFRRRPGGYLAEMTTLRVDGSAGGGAGRIFQAALADMIGRTVTLMLDAAGTIVDVRNRAAEWDRQMSALERATAGGSAARQATVAGLLAPLRALDAAAQTKRIGESIGGLLAPRIAAGGPVAERKVAVRGVGPAGPVELIGTEATTRQPGGTLRFERRGSSDALDIIETRVVGADGLARESVEVRTIRAGGRVLTTTRRTVTTL